MNVPSTPAGNRGGLRGVAAHPPRLLRWTLAPGGSTRGAGWVASLWGAREGASESAQMVLSVGVVVEKSAM